MAECARALAGVVLAQSPSALPSLLSRLLAGSRDGGLSFDVIEAILLAAVGFAACWV